MFDEVVRSGVHWLVSLPSIGNPITVASVVAAFFFLLVLAVRSLGTPIFQGKGEEWAERTAIYRAEAEREGRSDLWTKTADLAWEHAFQHLGDDPIEQARSTIEDQGFDRLEDEYIQKQKGNRTNCWRRDFSLKEISNDWAIDRHRPADREEDRTSVTDEVIEGLEGGGARTVVGPPGSGKSTTCKTVAIRWYERKDLGSVFYFQREEFDDPSGLKKALEEEAKVGRPLVVVEDVTDEQRIFETVQALTGDPEKLDVAFLFDSRSHEWENFGDPLRRPTDEEDEIAAIQGQIPTVRMPGLDPTEVRRVFEKFADVTERSRDDLPDHKAVYEQVSAEAADDRDESVVEGDHPPEVSEMLLLSYYLPVAGLETPDLDSEESSLVDNVRSAISEVQKLADEEETESGEAALVERVALLVNVLNAVGIDVHTEYVYTLADGDEFAPVKSALRSLQGTMHFGTRADGSYWLNHEVWSEFYLVVFLDEFETQNGVKATQTLFQECLSDFFGLTSEQRREQLAEAEPTSPLFGDDRDPGETADEHVVKVFTLAADRPAFDKWYQSSDESDIQWPGEASAEARVQSKVHLAQMFRKAGDRGQAVEELDAARTEVEGTDADEEWVEAIYATERGHVARYRGEYQKARECYRRIVESLEDIPVSWMATGLGNLGLVAQQQGDYEQAEQHHRRSLKIERELGSRQGEAKSLGNLGLVVRQQGDYEQAEQHHRRSLKIERELGNRQGEANQLGNLGAVELRQANYEAAHDYYEQSLAIIKNLGNRQGEAKILGNLGLVARQQGDYEQAEEYHRQSLEVARELGDRQGEANSLGNLGLVVQQQGDYEQAEEYHRQSLEIKRQLGDRQGEANSLGNLGLVVQQQSNYEQAKEYHRQGLEIARELGDRQGEANSLGNLGLVVQQQGNYEQAKEYHEQALKIERELGNVAGVASGLNNLGLVASEQKEYEGAREFYEAAAEIFREIGAVARLLKAYNNLVHVCIEQGNEDSAVEFAERAISTIEESEIPGLADQREQFEAVLAQL